MAEKGAEPGGGGQFRAPVPGDQHRGGALAEIAQQGQRGEALRPVRSTFVAPILPEPIALISPSPASRVTISPKGIDPSR